MSHSYSIEPIEGREALQRNFADLTKRGEAYSNRRVSLNERFSLIHRGFLLRPQLHSLPEPFANVNTKLVSLRCEEPEPKVVDKPTVNGQKFVPPKQPVTAIPAAFADDKDDGWE